MLESSEKKEKLIQYLSKVRDSEINKPVDEIDTEVVDSSVDLLLHLQEKEVTLSEENIEEKIAELPIGEKSITDSPAQKTVTKCNRRIFLVAAIVAILCSFFAISSLGNDPTDMFDYVAGIFGSVFDAPEGESIFRNGREFVNQGKGRTYETIEEFLENEDYDVLLPGEIPEGLNIIGVSVDDKLLKAITVAFDSCVTVFAVEFDKPLSETFINHANEIVDINGLKCYVCRLEDVNVIQICFIYNGDCYTVGGTDEQVLLSIIENLEERE